MSAKLTAVLDFLGSKFEAGIARANAKLAGFKQGVTGMNKTLSFLKGGIIGAAVFAGLNAVSRTIDDLRKAGDFSIISETQLRAFENARESAKGIRDAFLEAAAVRLGQVAEAFGFGKNASISEMTAASAETDKQSSLRKDIEAIAAAKTEGLKDDIRAAERAAITAKHAMDTAKTYTEILQATKDIALAEQKVADLKQKEIDRNNKLLQQERDRATAEKEASDAAALKNELEQQGGNPAYAAAMGDRAATLAEAALDPKKRREFMKGSRDQSRIDKLVDRYNRKMAHAGGAKTTAAERLAFESWSAGQESKSAMDDVADNTAQIAANTAGLISSIVLGGGAGGGKAKRGRGQRWKGGK
jgi:hypothetical protein